MFSHNVKILHFAVQSYIHRDNIAAVIQHNFGHLRMAHHLAQLAARARGQQVI